MSLESEIAEANAKIVRQLDEASKAIVVKAYTPLFDKVKTIALAYMKQLEISGINAGGLHFRPDGNFYSYSTYADDGKRPLGLELLPMYLNIKQKPTIKEGFTEYQSKMELVLNEFRNAIKNSLTELV